MQLPSDARTPIARAILAASTTLAFLSPWWWVPVPRLLPLAVLFAVLAAAAVSLRPDGTLVALGAGLGACLQPPDGSPELLPLLTALGAVHGAVATEVARLAAPLREERPVRSINDAALAGGAIVTVASLPLALVVGGVPLLAAASGMAMGGVALGRHLRAAAWLRGVADGRVWGAELRVTDSDQGLPTWSMHGPAAGPAQLLVLDPEAGVSLPAYRGAWRAVAVVRPARGIAGSRARPWFYAISVVVASLLVEATSLSKCSCGRTDALAGARQSAAALRSAAAHHRAVTGDCPSLVDLVASREVDPAHVHDPWAAPYRIACEGGDVTVGSPGPDSKWDTPDDVVVK